MNTRIVQELLQSLPVIKEQFAEMIPGTAEIIAPVKVHVIGNRNREESRKQVFELYGSAYKEDSETMLGETVDGKNGFAVLVYSEQIQIPEQLCHVIWHELGHIINKILNYDLVTRAEQDCYAGKDTELRNGYGVWSECVAEMIALTVENRMMCPHKETLLDYLDGLLDEAIGTGIVLADSLGFYMAYLCKEPFSMEYRKSFEQSIISKKQYKHEIMECLHIVSDIIGRQAIKKDFWVIDQEFLEELGCGFDYLWNEVYACRYSSISEISLRDRLKKES